MRRTATLLMLAVFLFHGGQRLSSLAQNPARTIEVHARRYGFNPSEITVKKGETIRLRLISDDVPHSLLIEELGINQEVTKSHQGEMTFTPTRAGDLQGRCGRFCGSGHGKMTFIVHVVGN